MSNEDLVDSIKFSTGFERKKFDSVESIDWPQTVNEYTDYMKDLDRKMYQALIIPKPEVAWLPPWSSEWSEGAGSPMADMRATIEMFKNMPAFIPDQAQIELMRIGFESFAKEYSGRLTIEGDPLETNARKIVGESYVLSLRDTTGKLPGVVVLEDGVCKRIDNKPGYQIVCKYSDLALIIASPGATWRTLAMAQRGWTPNIPVAFSEDIPEGLWTVDEFNRIAGAANLVNVLRNEVMRGRVNVTRVMENMLPEWQ